MGINRAAYGRKAKGLLDGHERASGAVPRPVPHPRFLFLDEPQNGPGPPDGIALSETLSRLRDKGNCVVISHASASRDPGRPDECIMIRHGRAVQVTDLTGVNLADLYQGGRVLNAVSLFARWSPTTGTRGISSPRCLGPSRPFCWVRGSQARRTEP